MDGERRWAEALQLDCMPGLTVSWLKQTWSCKVPIARHIRGVAVFGSKNFSLHVDKSVPFIPGLLLWNRTSFGYLLAAC